MRGPSFPLRVRWEPLDVFEEDWHGVTYILKDSKAISAVQVKDGANQGGSNEEGEKRSDSGYIDKAESTGFPDVLGIRLWGREKEK